MIDADASLEEIEALFKNDRFATEACGCKVLEGAQGYSVCEFEIADIHRNAQGGVMGGAIFTLADFALAIACNVGEEPTVSVAHGVEFMSAAKGNRLIATAKVDKSGSSLGFYTVEVTDELGTKVAKMTATCFRRPKPRS